MIPENIFTFWKGKRSTLIDVCLERVQKTTPRFQNRSSRCSYRESAWI